MAHARGFVGAFALFLIGCGGNNPAEPPDAGIAVEDAAMQQSPADLAMRDPADMLWPRVTHDAGPVSACAVPAAPVCTAQGFCVENPLPSTAEAIAVNGTGPDDVWVAAKHDTLLHFDGKSWGGRIGATGGEIAQVFAIVPGEVWVARQDGGIARGDGASFTAMLPAFVQGNNNYVQVLFAGSSSSDVWIWRGSNGKFDMNHWDGQQFQAVPPASYPTSLFAGAGGPVWAVNSYSINRFDGKSWVRDPAKTTESFGAMWGRAADDIYVIGNNAPAKMGALYHYDGKAWTLLPAPPAADYFGLTGAGGYLYATYWGPNRTGAGMIVFDGTTWTPVLDPSTHKRMNSVFAAAPGDVWSLSPELLRWNGKAESIVGCRTARESLQTAWAANDREAWIVGQRDGETASTLYHFDGDRWSGGLTGSAIEALAGTASDDVWAAGEEIRHFDGKAWSVALAGGPYRVHAVKAVSRTEAYAAADQGTILRWDGSSWTKLAGPPPGAWSGAIGMVMNGPNDIHVVTTEGGIYRWNGRSWTTLADEIANNRVMFSATKTGEYWVSRNGGGCDGSWSVVLEHWDGSKLEEVYAGGGGNGPSAMFAAGPNDVWFAASDALWHYTGNEVLDSHLDHINIWGTEYTAVGGRAPDDLWVVGTRGYLAHWDGKKWTEAPSGTEEPLMRVAVTGGGVFLFGNDGGMLRKR